jgi:PAS domain S-box-containing protein
MNDQDKPRPQLLEELTSLRRRLDALIDNLPEGFMFVDAPDVTIRDTSRYGREMLGVSREEFEGIGSNDHFRYYQVLRPDGSAVERTELPLRRALFAGEVIRNEEWLLQTRDGRRIPILCHAGPVRDDNGEIVSAIITWQDISARKQAEEELKKAHTDLEDRIADVRLNEARLEAVLKLNRMVERPLKEITDFAMEHAVALTKSKIGYVAFMNDDETVLTMHSWSREAMKECAVAVKPFDYPLETTGLWGEAARQKEPIVTNDYAATNSWKKGLPEGHVKLFRHMNVPVLEEGRVVIVAGVGNKETDYDDSDVRQLTLLMEGLWALIHRQRAQLEVERHRDHLEQLVAERTKALRASELRYRQVFESVSDSLLIVGDEKRIVGANPAACAEYGYSPDEFARLSILDLIAPERQADSQAAGKELAEKGYFSFTNSMNIRKDGTTFHVEVAGRNFDARGEKLSLCLVRNIDQRWRAEEARLREYRTLKHLLQSSDHERQTIAYEIHDGVAQYLAGSLMQFDVYKDRLNKNPEEAAEVFEIAVSLLRQGHFEVRRLIAGVRPPVLDEAGVVEAVAHLINEQNRHGGPQIEFNSRVRFSRLMPILENAIYRICQEGLANACKHSHSDRVRIRLSQIEDRIRIEIRDWGDGFDPSHVQENRFGLIGIRQRVRLLGGRHRIQSAPAKGTRLTVELPIMERDR